MMPCVHRVLKSLADNVFFHSRLYTSGQRDRNAPEPKLEIVQAKYDDNGREVLSPVKKVSYEEQTTYMCELYSRCIESKKKAEEKLADKYLKPLGKGK